MSRGERKAMIRRDLPGLSLSQQCQVLAISRSSFYYAPKGEWTCRGLVDTSDRATNALKR